MSSRKFLVAALALTAVLSAGAGSAGAATSGTAVVEAKNVKDGTVTLAGTVYRVTATTRILDAKGKPMPLAALPVAQIRRDDGSVDVSGAVFFEATETGSGAVLEEVRVVGEMPR